MTPSNTLRRAALAALVALGVPIGAAALEVGQVVGTDAAAITAAVAPKGYRVREYEREDGEIEVKLEKDGRRVEIYVDGASGAITKIESKS